MSARAELRDLVRQIRTEIEWAQRIGIVIDPPREMPVEAAPKPPPKPRASTPTPPPRTTPPPPPMQRPSGPPSPEAMAAREAARAAVFGLANNATPPPRIEPDRDFKPSFDRGSTPVPTRLPMSRLETPLPATPLPPPPPEPPSLEAVRADLGDCTRCKLHKTRKNIVFGVGNPNAELMFIGEGPGADEDIQGEPFVGDAGALLTKMIEAMGFKRSDVYIANIVKCRPPNNRDPEPDEIDACEPFLRAQIATVKPRIIVTLGKPASHLLLRTNQPITSLRGNWSRYLDIPVMPTFHPAYILREPAQKRPVWNDLQAVVRALGRSLPERGGG